MLQNIFLGMSMVGAEWVLYLLVILSILSITLIFERSKFYRDANRGIVDFRQKLRQAAAQGKWDEATRLASEREAGGSSAHDLEAGLARALLSHRAEGDKSTATEVLNEVAQSAVLQSRIHWDRNLAVLATIGSNAPFIGLFGTVLGIIKAFHDLSSQSAGVQTVSSGISEALVATAVGILVAIPAVVAFNLFQRKVKAAVAEAESLKSYLVGKMAVK